MSTAASRGKEAEESVASYLEKQGHTILELNWRTRRCEIDVVSKKDAVVYFTEVKYRTSAAWGSGFDYIHKKKLEQMRFAAEYWLMHNDWSGMSQLQAAEVRPEGGIELVSID